MQQYVRSGKLTAGHARMLVGQPNAEEIANEIVTRGLNVRQVEAMARKSGKEQAKEVRGTKRRGGKDADTAALEKRVSDALGLQVTVDHHGDWGVLHIHYSSLEQLDEDTVLDCRVAARKHVTSSGFTSSIRRMASFSAFPMLSRSVSFSRVENRAPSGRYSTPRA